MPGIQRIILNTFRDYGFFILTVIAAVFPLIISTSAILFYRELETLISRGSEGLMVLFFLVATITMAFALTPTTFIAIVSGYFWGWKAWAGILLSYPLAAFLGRFAGLVFKRWFSGSKVIRHPRFQSISQGLSRSQMSTLIFARLSPVLPFAMTNILLAQVKINPWIYLAGTMIGMLPRTLIFFLAGMNAREILALLQNPQAGTSGNVITLTLFLISSIGLFWIFRKIWLRDGA